ncbi:MAG: type IV pili methyl-accepting chemotaxis transducer N-terminal domain-containing protein [Betaproteobacteria bacterium]|nr:type IV pili methyl-accepting chemotaxis transducer N-terminal domain-containing protein [Betaproteobacteria bacterium]
MEREQRTMKPFGRSRLPVIGAKPLNQQMLILGVMLLVLLVAAAVFVWLGNRAATHGTAYLSATGQMRTLSQRIAKATQAAAQGSAESFRELREGRDTFTVLLEALTRGGNVGDTTVPPSPADAQAALEPLAATWNQTERNAGLVLQQEKSLVALGVMVAEYNRRNPHLFELVEGINGLRLQAGASAREISAIGQMGMLSQRIVKNANALAASESGDPESAFLFGKDTATFSDLIGGLLRGSESLKLAAMPEGDARTRLVELEAAYREFQQVGADALAGLPKIVQAKQAGSRIIRDSGNLLEGVDKVGGVYEDMLGRRGLMTAASALSALLALATLGLMVKVLGDDGARRRDEAERSRLVAEADREATQQAILRLMNEMGDLADGDLTIRATVTEDFTGAIADSVNYTIEELSVLVKRINDTASRVNAAAEAAQQTSTDLLEAAERQSREIQDANRAALSMARSMTEVSASAVQSAQVARQSLDAARKGANAVEDSIKGMHEIRGHIQETSKRIKRLGESSQEIGEIVELISDITEQTNVLALNAAIQAASAGEAGRGFSVVAEEVQRLAERSGEATKQIAAIVKTIQTDTQDAVMAMESSTRGVVEGTVLSDAAGQALAEISTVSGNLAQLIEAISVSTHDQASSATRVAEAMNTILGITEHTTAGTRETAESIGQLAELANELKGSVAGFKV